MVSQRVLGPFRPNGRRLRQLLPSRVILQVGWPGRADEIDDAAERPRLPRDRHSCLMD